MAEEHAEAPPNNHSGVKLQINSLAALERLLGDNPLLEVELRKGVIKNYFAQSIEQKLNQRVEAEFNKIASTLQETVNRKAEQILGVQRSNLTSRVNLAPDVCERIKNETLFVMREEIEKCRVAAAALIETGITRLASRIPEYVEAQRVKHIDDAIKEGITQRLAELRTLLPLTHETRMVTITPSPPLPPSA